MAAAAKLSTSVPVLQGQLAKKDAALVDARADNRALEARVSSVVAESGRRERSFLRHTLPMVGLYGGIGFGAGAGLAWFLYSYLTDWFGKTSYVPGLVMFGAGVGLFMATPSLVRVSARHMEKTAPIATGLYGASAGIAAYGLYEAYLVYSAPPAKP